MRASQTRVLVLAGTGAVVAGGIVAAAGSWSEQVNLRSGVIPWAFGTMVAGIAQILFGSYQCGIGHPRWLLRWGSSLALVGLAAAIAFLFGTGILAFVGSDLLSTGDTFVSAAGTLAASVMTLLVLPVGLVAVGVAVLGDKDRPTGVRCLPLIGTLVFTIGPVLVAVLPESGEGPVLIVWPVLLAAAWSAYGVLVAVEIHRQPRTADVRAVTGRP